MTVQTNLLGSTSLLSRDEPDPSGERQPPAPDRRRARTPTPRPSRHPRRLLAAESRAFSLAAALCALYLLDYAFVDPQPGTSAGDHLISGLVPTGLLAVTAAGYPRLRAGLRAAVALGVGIIVVASVAPGPLRHAVIAGASGADFTAMLAAAGGAALVGLGARVLWRARRSDEARARRYVRRVAAGAGAIVAIFLMYPIVLGFIATHNARVPVPGAQLGASFRIVTFTTSDGLKLVGWYVPSRNGAAVIVSPGRSPWVQAHARVLIRHRFGVLMFDRRGEGQSQGEPNLFGWSGDKDLIAAAGFLARQPDVRGGRIGGLGLSVGGEMLLQAAAETSALKAVVSESAGARSVKEALEFPDTPAKWLQLVPWFALATPVTAMFADRMPPPSLTSLIPRIEPRAVLLIWAGRGAGEDVNPHYFDLARSPKAIWEIPEAGHVGGLSARPAEYEQRVTSFFDRTLVSPGAAY